MPGLTRLVLISIPWQGGNPISRDKMNDLNVNLLLTGNLLSCNVLVEYLLT